MYSGLSIPVHRLGGTPIHQAKLILNMKLSFYVELTVPIYTYRTTVLNFIETAYKIWPKYL